MFSRSTVHFLPSFYLFQLIKLGLFSSIIIEACVLLVNHLWIFSVTPYHKRSKTAILCILPTGQRSKLWRFPDIQLTKRHFWGYFIDNFELCTTIEVQWKPLNAITLGHRETDDLNGQCFPKSGPRTIYGPRDFPNWSVRKKGTILFL